MFRNLREGDEDLKNDLKALGGGLGAVAVLAGIVGLAMQPYKHTYGIMALDNHDARMGEVGQRSDLAKVREGRNQCMLDTANVSSEDRSGILANCGGIQNATAGCVARSMGYWRYAWHSAEIAQCAHKAEDDLAARGKIIAGDKYVSGVVGEVESLGVDKSSKASILDGVYACVAQRNKDITWRLSGEELSNALTICGDLKQATALCLADSSYDPTSGYKAIAEVVQDAEAGCLVPIAKKNGLTD